MFRLFEFLIPLLFFALGIRVFTRVIRGILGGPDSSFRQRLIDRRRRMMRNFMPGYEEESRQDFLPGHGAEAFESEVFKLADRQHGRLTLSDVVLATGRGMKESEGLLEKMVDGNHVRMEVDERGIVIYEFPEIIRRYES